MELFVLGLVFGAATAQGKAVTKAVAKGYMAVSEKTRDVVSTLKEDMRGAIEEARVERDQEEPATETAGHEAEALALREETVTAGPIKKKASKAAAPIPSGVTGSTPASSSVVTTKQTPTVMKSLAKRYMVMTEKTRDAVSGIRENVRDAIEEARYERELAAKRAAESEAEAAAADTAVAGAPVVESPAPVKIAAAPPTRSTRRKPAVAMTIAETPTPTRSKRTKTVPVAAAVAAPPAKRGRPRKVAATQSEALLEVAEIAADAL